MAETKDALKAEVPTVCRTYCTQTWEEALNQAGVEASSMLRRAKSVYYPPTIRFTSSSDSKVDPAPSKAARAQGSPPKPLLQLILLLRVGSRPRTLQKLGMPTKAQSKALT